ncbi:hypothetical protein [Leisingera sp.]|uniref:hypothetical protein n=1 Tax=Leisingera sp. TaxID=1879318 RepID=UPI002B268A01|nr:hypothetical protein [Leisingera sp.]
MADANSGDFTRHEEPEADHAAGALPFCSSEQLHHCIEMGQIVLGLRGLRLLRLDPDEYLGAFLCLRLDDLGFGDADIGTGTNPQSSR